MIETKHPQLLLQAGGSFVPQSWALHPLGEYSSQLTVEDLGSNIPSIALDKPLAPKSPRTKEDWAPASFCCCYGTIDFLRLSDPTFVAAIYCSLRIDRESPSHRLPKKNEGFSDASYRFTAKGSMASGRLANRMAGLRSDAGL